MSALTVKRGHRMGTGYLVGFILPLSVPVLPVIHEMSHFVHYMLPAMVFVPPQKAQKWCSWLTMDRNHQNLSQKNPSPLSNPLWNSATTKKSY